MPLENQTPTPLHSTHNVIAARLREQILAGRYAPRDTVRARAEGGRVVFDKV